MSLAQRHSVHSPMSEPMAVTPASLVGEAESQSILRRDCSYYKRGSFLGTLFLVGFVLFLILFGYFTFHIHTLPFTYALSPSVAIVEAVVYNILAVGSLFSYFSTMFTDPGGVPLDTSSLPRIERKNGDFRRCVKCAIVKPDRAHHCSMCNTCTLKMDHHCPWTNNCIGFRNYKYFCLFVLYTPFLCVWNLAVSLPNIFIVGFHEFSVGEICVFATCFIAVAFAFTLFAFFGSHLMLVMYNQTTLESYYDDFNPYDMGTKANFHQVFGVSGLRWFLPVSNYLGNGLAWPAKIPKNAEDTTRKVANEAEADRAQLLTTSPQQGASIMSRRFDDDEVELDLESSDY